MAEFIGQDGYTPNTYINTDTVLSNGAVGYERATGKYKVGNGVTPWDSLDYVLGEVVNGLLINSGGSSFNVDLASLEDTEISNINDNDILVYDSLTGLWKNQVKDTNNMTEEAVEDTVATLFSNGSHQNVTVTYDDVNNSISLIGQTGSSNLTQEQVEDYVGGVVVGGTGITAAYNDAGNQLTISLSGVQFTQSLLTKLNSISDYADKTSDNETSHEDVLVDGDFQTAGFMKTDGNGVYSVDSVQYQSLLISGTTIKTINNQSLLGNGNISIDGNTSSGDMLTSTYDTNSNGIVDNAEKVNNLTVLTAVPLNAVFTDTIYVKPQSEPISYITGLQTALNAKQDTLISGDNIRTINGNTLLGNTDLIIDTSGSSSFLGLTDTPAVFQANKYIRVNTTGDGLIFEDTAAGGINTVVGGTDISVDNSDPSNPVVNFSGNSVTGATFTRETLEITDNNTVISTNKLTGGPSTAWLDIYSDGTVIAIDNAKKVYTVEISTGVMTETDTFGEYHPRGIAIGSNDVAYYHTGSYLKRVDTDVQEFNLTGTQVSNASGLTCTEDRKFIIAFASGLADFISIDTMAYSHTEIVNTVLTNSSISPLFLGDYVYTLDLVNNVLLRFPISDLTSDGEVIQTLLTFETNSVDRSIFKTVDNKIAISSMYNINGSTTFGISIIDPQVVSSELTYGNMLTTIYDTNNSGVVDNAEKVNNLTVLTDVPANAIFTDTTYSVGDNGLTKNNFTDSLKTKLDGIEAGANAYTHPTGDGALHVPANGTSNSGKVLTASGTAGVYTWETPSGGGANSTTLSSLTDVTLATPVGSDILYYSNGDWVNFSSTVFARNDLTNTFSKPQLSSISVANSGSYDLSLMNKFSTTISAATTLDFTNIVGQNGMGGTIYFDNSTGQTISKTSTVLVDSGFLSTISVAGIYIIGFEVFNDKAYLTTSGALS